MAQAACLAVPHEAAICYADPGARLGTGNRNVQRLIALADPIALIALASLASLAAGHAQPQPAHRACDGRAEHLIDHDAATPLDMLERKKAAVGQECDLQAALIGDAPQAQIVRARRRQPGWTLFDAWTHRPPESPRRPASYRNQVRRSVSSIHTSMRLAVAMSRYSSHTLWASRSRAASALLSSRSSASMSEGSTYSASLSDTRFSRAMCPTECSVEPPTLRTRSAIGSLIANTWSACSSNSR